MLIFTESLMLRATEAETALSSLQKHMFSYHILEHVEALKLTATNVNKGDETDWYFSSAWQLAAQSQFQWADFYGPVKNNKLT